MDEARVAAARDAQARRPPAVESSDDAAWSMRGHAGRLCEEVYRLVVDAGFHGITCDEAEERLAGAHQTISARFRDLVLAERICDSGDRRKTRSGRMARVYVRRLS